MAEDALLQMARSIRNGAKGVKERNSEGVLDFIVGNPRLFGVGRTRMSTLVEELRQRSDLSVAALCDALDLPDSLMFRKAKLVEASSLVMYPLRSPIYRKFLQEVAGRRSAGSLDHDPELTVVVVAGSHSTVLTNLIPRRVPGLVHLSVPAEEGHEDVHIFPVADAAARLPQVFNQEREE